MSQPCRTWAAHACYRYDLFQKQTDLTVEERETLLRTPPPKIPDVVLAFLDNEELQHKTEQEIRQVALLVSAIRADPRMRAVMRVRERDKRTAGEEPKKKRVAGRKRCWADREAAEGGDSATHMSDDDDDDEKGRPSACKKAKTVTTTTIRTTCGGGGRYMSMKRALAVIQSIAQQHKECANLEQWVVARWNERRCAQARVRRLQLQQQGEEGHQETNGCKLPEAEPEVKKCQQRQSVVKRVRNTDKDKQNKQQQDKIMHAHVLNGLKSMQQATEEQVAEGLQRMQARKTELLGLRDQTRSQMERDEERVKQWLMTLDKHTFLLNDGALRIAKTRRTGTRGAKTSRCSNKKTDVGAKQRLTTRWVLDAGRSYLSQDTRLSIEKAHAIAQQMERLV